jgi:hypothetical protein
MFEKMVRNGILITVATLIVTVLGLVAATRIPVQMIPDLEVRTISVRTTWPGATPQDVEKEILIEQEDQLRSVPGLQRIVSSAAFGRARVELEFPFGIDLNQTLIDVITALNRVSAYPDNVDEPRIYATSFSSNSFMYFRVMPLPGNPRNLDMAPQQDFVRDNVASRLETVPGVSEVSTYGGAARQIQILVDPARLAERNLTIGQLRSAIRERNRDVSGGEIESGKRRYLLRTIGRFDSIEDLEQVIVDASGDALTRLGEVAEIRLGHFEINRFFYTNGSTALGMSVRRQAGSNVIDIKRQMMPLVDEINRDLLNPAGMQMRLLADDVGYVEASIYNVWTNLLIGAALASLVMHGDPDLHHRRVCRAGARRAHDQRDFARRRCVCDRHDAGQQHRRAREYRERLAARTGSLAGRGRGRAQSLAGSARLDPDDGAGVRADRFHRAGGRTTLFRCRDRDFGVDHRLDAGRDRGYPGRGRQGIRRQSRGGGGVQRLARRGDRRRGLDDHDALAPCRGDRDRGRRLRVDHRLPDAARRVPARG